MDHWEEEKRTEFYFYGKKFTIIWRDYEYGSFIVCVSPQLGEVCIARQFGTIWFIVYGRTGVKGKFVDAYHKIKKNVFDALQAEV